MKKYEYLLLTLFIKFPLLASELKDEEEWIKLYGTHKKYSGSWPLARYLRLHPDELRLFCAKTHELWTNQTNVTTQEAYVNHWLITFDDSRIKPIWADMIMYAEERERPPPEILGLYYMIKGNRPDCVFYMNRERRFRQEGFDMLFGEHVCGITGFEEFPSNKSR